MLFVETAETDLKFCLKAFIFILLDQIDLYPQLITEILLRKLRQFEFFSMAKQRTCGLADR